MSEPTTPTGKRLYDVLQTHDYDAWALDILAIEDEAMDLAGDYRTSVETIAENAAKAERERLGLDECGPKCSGRHAHINRPEPRPPVFIIEDDR